MPKNKSQKQEIMSKIKDNLAKAKSVVFFNFSGIPVKELDTLRRGSKEQGAEYLVAKKTLLKKALAESGYQDVQEENLSGEVGVIFGYEDEIVPAKLIKNFGKGHDQAKVLGGLLEGSFMAETKVTALSKLPGRPELLAKAVGSIAAPLSGLVNVLQGNLRGLVCALNAIKDKKA